MSRPGLLRRLGDVERDQGPETRDANLGSVADWVVAEAGVWFGYEPLTPNQKLKAGGLESNVDGRITVRVPHSLQAGRRVVEEGGRGTYLITSAPLNVKDADRYAWAFCSERGE